MPGGNVAGMAQAWPRPCNSRHLMPSLSYFTSPFFCYYRVTVTVVFTIFGRLGIAGPQRRERGP